MVDDIEEDESFLTLVSTLQDLFPEFALSEIKARVKSTDDIDAIISDLYLNREIEFEDVDLRQYKYDVDPNKYSEDVYQLKEIFPDFDLDVLNKTFEDNHKDVQSTSEALLSGSIYRKSTTATFDVEKYIGLNDEGELISEDIANITRLTCLTRKEAFLYLKKNYFNCIETLIDIIENYYSRKPTLNDGIPNGGRVQRAGGAGGTGGDRRGVYNWYLYNPNSKEARELNDFRAGDQLLQHISEAFFKKALVFFKGDYQKVIEVTLWIVENEGLNYFMHKKHSNPDKPGPPKPNWKQFIQDFEKGRPKNVVSNSPGPLTAEKYRVMGDALRAKVKSADQDLSSKLYRNMLNDEDYFAMKERIESFYNTANLDLHRLSVRSALSATLTCLEVWWQEELSLRDYEGKYHKYSSRAQFTSPMLIVTGRGIHSIGGVSRIRQTVLSTLNKLGYIYNENVGSFEIIGRHQ